MLLFYSCTQCSFALEIPLFILPFPFSAIIDWFSFFLSRKVVLDWVVCFVHFLTLLTFFLYCFARGPGSGSMFCSLLCCSRMFFYCCQFRLLVCQYSSLHAASSSCRMQRCEVSMRFDGCQKDRRAARMFDQLTAKPKTSAKRTNSGDDRDGRPDAR